MAEIESIVAGLIIIMSDPFLALCFGVSLALLFLLVVEVAQWLK